MKIAWTTYPFAGLPGTSKRPVSVTAGGGRIAAGDVSFLSARPGVAILRHLRAIEEMASEIMSLTGDPLPAAVDEYPGQAFANVPRSSAIAHGDILVYFPGHVSGGEGEDLQGELVVVKGMGWPEDAGLAEGCQEEVLQAVAKDVAEALARCGSGLVSDPSGPDPSQVREKFIISVDTVDGAPAATVIRHGPSGGITAYNSNGGGELSGEAIPREIAVITGLLSGAEEEVPVEHLQHILEAPSATTQTRGRQETAGPAEEGMSRMTVRSFLSDPGAAMKDAGRMLQRLFVTSDGQGEEGRAEDAEDTAALSDADGAPTFSSAGPASVTVTFMGQLEPAAQTSAAVNAPIAGEIAVKVAAFSDAVNGIIAGSPPDVAPRGEGAENTETEGEGYALVREALKRAVAASFAGAFKELTGMDGSDAAKSTGMSLDERGLLKVDAGVLHDALSGGKGETVRFVHDLTASLHERIAYNPLACAGLHAGSPEAVLESPSGKERGAGDDADRRVSFEKRLNELQMLLKSSYQLKDSFMHRSFAGGDG
jgi:hypothetical protein